MNAIGNALLPFVLMAGAFLVVVYLYSRRASLDLPSSYLLVFLVIAKWLAATISVMGVLISFIDLLYGWAGNDIGGSVWIFVVVGFGSIAVGFGLWRFFGAWLRHEKKRLVEMKPDSITYA